MKVLSISLAVACLIQSGSALSLSQRDVTPVDQGPIENELLSCGQNEEGGWKTDLPGLYENSSVTQVDGDDALKTLSASNL